MDIRQLHRSEYEASPEVVAHAPGVIRLLGDHTAEAGGQYLALPFNRYVSVAASPRKDASLRFYAADLNERKRSSAANLKFRREDRWANYLKGAILAMTDGVPLAHGWNFTISGDIPQALGLGSSTALLVCSLRLAAILAGRKLDAAQTEQAAYELASTYLEKSALPSDAAACIRAKPGAMVVVDARDGKSETLSLPLGKYGLYLTDSRVPRPPVDRELKARVADCAKGLSMLGGGARGLRAYTVADLDEHLGVMPEHIRRHCTFFMEEMGRIRDARDALKRKDLPAFGRCLYKSQMGLRNHYELSCPEIDWLVKRATEIDGVLASRMVGRGFGGCTITLMPQDAEDAYRERLEEYERIFGFKPSLNKIGPWKVPDEPAER